MSQLIEIQYFGCICYYINLIKGKYLVLEQFETYQKMSFRNRCQILGADKVIDLSVPLLGGRDQKRLIREVEIDHSGNWQKQHWRTIESCYNKSPFFLHYRDGLEALLFKTYKSLWELNEASIRWVIARLKTPVEITCTTQFEKQPDGDWSDLRNHFLPANRALYRLSSYMQVFDRPFETNLCILDLLFNLGPQSAGYLLKQEMDIR